MRIGYGISGKSDISFPISHSVFLALVIQIRMERRGSSRVALGNDDLLDLKFGRSGKGREGFMSAACMDP